MGKEINPINSNLTRQRQKFSKEFKLNAVASLKAGQKSKKWKSKKWGQTP